jgi:hypothetical protein
MNEHGAASTERWETKERCLCGAQFVTRRELAEHISGRREGTAMQDIERLERRIADLEQRIAALENPPCCKGGPQWGHDWHCPTLP